jgi:hypothetical protein
MYMVSCTWQQAARQDCLEEPLDRSMEQMLGGLNDGPIALDLDRVTLPSADALAVSR